MLNRKCGACCPRISFSISKFSETRYIAICIQSLAFENDLLLFQMLHPVNEASNSRFVFKQATYRVGHFINAPFAREKHVLSMAECLELSEAAKQSRHQCLCDELVLRRFVSNSHRWYSQHALAPCMSLGPWDRCCHMHAFQKGLIVTSQEKVLLSTHTTTQRIEEVIPKLFAFGTTLFVGPFNHTMLTVLGIPLCSGKAPNNHDYSTTSSFSL
jgi:hypothetical protein